MGCRQAETTFAARTSVGMNTGHTLEARNFTTSEQLAKELAFNCTPLAKGRRPQTLLNRHSHSTSVRQEHGGL